MKSNSEHWDSIFSDTDDSVLGWYEKDTSRTFELINLIPNLESSTVFIPGAGTSILIKELYDKCIRLILNDISREALNRLRKRLRDSCGKINWLCQDISLPIQNALPEIDIWIDRAVLHFLVDEANIKGYFKNIKSKLAVGGHIIFAEFSKAGASECAGLILRRYSIEELTERLGPSFKLVSHFDHTHINPRGDPRPYIYGLYQRIA